MERIESGKSIYSLLWASVAMTACTCFAEPVAEPAESWADYDLIAKVVVRSVDTNREIQTYASSEAQSFAHPAEIEVVERLRMPDEVAGPLNLLIPSYSNYKGKRLECPLFTGGVHSSTNVIAVAGRYIDGKKWLLLEWLLSDEWWAKYRKQMESGIVGPNANIPSEEDRERIDAANKMKELNRQVRAGKISMEECNRQSAPLSEILNRPIQLESF